jgi:hypothetical protein
MRIKNWDKFQHYHHRRPPWIKFYIDNIEEFKDDGEVNDFFSLPDHAKLALMLAWLLASHFNGNLPDKPEKWLANRLGIKDFPLQLLKDKGFIEDASNVASVPASKGASKVARAEKSRVERERRERDRDRLDTPPSSAGKVEQIIPGIDPQPMTEEQQKEFNAQMKKITDQMKGAFDD